MIIDIDIAPTPNFQRSSFTWLAYAMLGYFAYAQSSLGPIMPLLRQELNLSFTLGGLHASGFALGVVFCGLVSEKIVARWGRPAVFWGSGAGLGVGVLLLLAAPSVAFTLLATTFMGFFGGLLLVMVQAVLSDEHGESRSVALLEANIVAMIAATALPLFVGGFEKIGVGWRMALMVPLLGWGLMWLFFRRVQLPPAVEFSPVRGTRKRALPPVFWLIWLITFLSVSAEWCLALWTADFLLISLGLPAATAAFLVIVFTGAGVLGRLFGSRLARRVATIPLLLLALLVLIAGFPLLWLAPSLTVKLVGLFLAGFGSLMLYPLCVAGGAQVAPGQANRASARISLAAGLAILINPQALGIVADIVGIQTAMGLTAVFATVALLLTLLVQRRTRQEEVAASG